MNDYDLILDYITGSDRIPEEFRRAVSRWISEHADDPELAESMRRVWEREVSNSKNNIEITGLSRVMDEIDPSWDDAFVAEYAGKGKRFVRIFGRRLKKSVTYVAAVAIVAFLSVLSYFIGNYSANDITVVQTAKGAIMEFYLPDGSKVLLNGGSRLSYSNEKYSHGASRDVQLDGEAYFDVTHNGDRPFHVDMSGIDVEVLGTTFDAKNYGHSPLKEVVLLSGKVKIEERKGGKKTHTLYPDQRYVYNSVNNKSEVESAKAIEYCSWHVKDMKIENEPLRKVLIILSRKYYLDLEIADDVDVDRKISLTISDESVESVMETISFIADLRYEIDNNILRINNKQ